METHSLEVARTIYAPRDRVFAAFLDAQADIMQKFAPTMPDGTAMRFVVHKLEPRVGGAIEYGMLPEGVPAGAGHRIVGVYKQIDDGERIVRTETPPMPDGSTGPETLVTFLFEDAEVEGRPATQITIRHEGFPDPKWAKGAEFGWAGALENLALAYQEIA